ncbi:MAG: right-handed parallel beta-helix repeat-containing protein [Bacteroidota bacterium]
MRALLLTLALLLPTAASAQLSGTYTIGGASPDYATISEAVSDLDDFGLGGPVTFLLRPGVYSDQINPGALGTSATNTFEIRSENPSNRATIKVDATASANYVWRINNTKFVTFRDIDFIEANNDAFGRILVIEGTSSDITVDGCTFSGRIGALTDSGSLVWADPSSHDNLTFTGNTFTSGYGGLDLDQFFTLGNSTGLDVIGNVFEDQLRFGVDVTSGVDQTTLSANMISSRPNTDLYTGILFSGTGEITDNVVDAQNRALFAGGSTTALIANNFFAVESSSGLDEGVDLTGSASVDFFHNTVYVYGTSAGRALKSASTSGDGSDISIQNNLLINETGGPALSFRVNGPFAGTSDYNDLFTTGDVLVEDDGESYLTLDDYQDGTDLDLNSVAVPVTFADAQSADLHLAGGSVSDPDLLGLPVGITEDIDGDPRSATRPYMGADEGEDLSPLAGTYSVGVPGLSDFDDPFEAIAALNARGISAPVLFDILAFDYTGQAVIEDFERVGAADDPVTFRGNFIDQPGFPRPTLRYAAAGSADNYILLLDGADFVTIERLEFEATGTNNIGRLIVLDDGPDGEGVDDLTVRDNTLEGIVWVGPAGNPGGAELVATIDNATGGHDRARFTGNTFIDGTNGLRLSPTDNPGARNEDAEVSGNTFTDLRSTAMFAHAPAITVQGNTVTSDEGGGFQLFYGDGGCTITENRITLGVPSFNGINLRVDGTEAEPCLVANNFVSADRPVRIDGGSSFVRVLHNTLFSKDERVLWVPNASDVTVLNNILYHSAGGFAFEASASAIAEADHNALFTTGSSLARISSVNYTDLAAYQAGTGFGANSVSKTVTFADAPGGDLHLTGSSDGDDDLGGTPLAEVPTDIDGEDRGTPPYMGADEASALTPPANFDLVAAATSPLTVAPGGSVSFDYTIANNTANPATGDLWFAASPGGFDGIIVSGTLPGGQTFSGSYTQPVPGFTPPGTYAYDLNIGNFPNLIVDTETFTVTVTGAAREGGAEAWAVTEATPWPTFEEAEGELEAASEALPSEFALAAAYPNPFTRSATVGFALPEAASVRVSVYDVLGREVAVLVDAPLEAGRHAVQLEAGRLASGVYLVRMVAGGYAAVERVTLAR